MAHAEQPRFPGTVLQKILLTLIPLGLVLYGLIRGTDADLHLEIGFTAFLLVYVVTFIDLTLGIAILIACVGLSPEFTIGGIQNIRLEDFVVPALLISWVTRMVQQRVPMAPLLVTPALPLYGAAIVLSTLIGVAADSTKLLDAVLYMGKFSEFFLIYLLLINNITRREEFRALAVFSVIVALTSDLMASNAFLEDGSSRLSGPLGETANMFGGYLILNLAVALGLFLQSPTNGTRLACASVVVLLGIALLYTYSRTSFVAILVAATLFGILKDRRLLLVTLIVGLITPLIAPQSIMDRLTTISGVATGDEPSSWTSRVDAWNHWGGKTLRTNPLLGSGLASVKLGMVDNEYVRVFVDTGALGLGLFLWVLVRLGMRATKLIDRFGPRTFERGYASGYWIAFFAMAVHAVGATSYTSIRTMECFIVLTGIFGALCNHAEEWGALDSVSPGGGTVLIAGSPALEPQPLVRGR